MVKFSLNINDPKSGKSYKKEIEGEMKEREKEGGGKRWKTLRIERKRKMKS